MKQPPNMKLKKEIAKRLKEIRMENGLSQGDAADKIGISRVYYNRLESLEIEVMPSRPVIKKICEAFDVKPEWLLDGKGFKNDAEALSIYTRGHKKEYSSSLKNQMEEYTVLKVQNVFADLKMNPFCQEHYFHLFRTIDDLKYRLLADIKEFYNRNEPVPDELYDSYMQEFNKLLNSQKQ